MLNSITNNVNNEYFNIIERDECGTAILDRYIYSLNPSPTRITIGSMLCPTDTVRKVEKYCEKFLAKNGKYNYDSSGGFEQDFLDEFCDAVKRMPKRSIKYLVITSLLATTTYNCGAFSSYYSIDWWYYGENDFGIEIESR
jgi:hypothetical protein